MFDTLYKRLTKLVKEEVAKRRAESAQILRHCEPAGAWQSNCDAIANQRGGTIANILPTNISRHCESAGAWQSISKNSKIVIEEITGLLRFARNDEKSLGLLCHFVPRNDEKLRKKIAFTLAEVLITIGIVGVVAAMVLPTINKKIQIMETEVNLKKTYSTIQQAVRRSVADNGNFDVSLDTTPSGFISQLETGLLPYLSGATLDKKTHPVSYYGYKNGIKNLDGSWFLQSNTSSTFIRLSNGVNIFIGIVTSSATYKGNLYTFLEGYALFTDINGPKGPNAFGKDIFSIHINTKTSDVTMGTDYYYKNVSYGNDGNPDGLKDKSLLSRQELIENCKISVYYCGALIKRDGWKISKDYPIKF